MRKITVDVYKGMSSWEINDIVKRGGDAKTQLNRAVSDYLDTLDLSDKAREIINTTYPVCEVFGGMFTAEDVEDAVNEYFGDEEEE